VIARFQGLGRSLTARLSVPWVVLAVPVDIGRDEARAAARRELSKPDYQRDQPGLVERFVRWSLDRLQDLLDRASEVSPFGWVGLVVLGLLIVLAVIAVRLRLGPLARSERQEQPLFGGRELSADEHRTAAGTHAAAGEWAEAVREQLRAIVRDLEQRGLLEPRPGRTADEAAREAGLALPDCAAALVSGARLFDEIWYGGRRATESGYATMRALDAQVRAARPVTAGIAG
jgi:hypothetical protein